MKNSINVEEFEFYLKDYESSTRFVALRMSDHKPVAALLRFGAKRYAEAARTAVRQVRLLATD